MSGYLVEVVVVVDGVSELLVVLVLDVQLVQCLVYGGHVLLRTKRHAKRTWRGRQRRKEGKAEPRFRITLLRSEGGENNPNRGLQGGLDTKHPDGTNNDKSRPDEDETSVSSVPGTRPARKTTNTRVVRDRLITSPPQPPTSLAKHPRSKPHNHPRSTTKQQFSTPPPPISCLSATHLLHGLEVVDGERQVLRFPQLVHHAAVVEVRGEHLQEPDELQGVLV